MAGDVAGRTKETPHPSKLFIATKNQKLKFHLTFFLLKMIVIEKSIIQQKKNYATKTPHCCKTFKSDLFVITAAVCCCAGEEEKEKNQK
jgi:hypothetical protein